MRNHDFVSDGFLALIATCLVLLCSSLLLDRGAGRISGVGHLRNSMTPGCGGGL